MSLLIADDFTGQPASAPTGCIRRAGHKAFIDASARHKLTSCQDSPATYCVVCLRKRHCHYYATFRVGMLTHSVKMTIGYQKMIIITLFYCSAFKSPLRWRRRCNAPPPHADFAYFRHAAAQTPIEQLFYSAPAIILAAVSRSAACCLSPGNNLRFARRAPDRI